MSSRETLTDWLLFNASLSQFKHKKDINWHGDLLDWSDDGCSHASDCPAGRWCFLIGCQRHDFGYRNYGRQSRCDEKRREKIDRKLLRDLNDICDNHHFISRAACQGTANLYYRAVRDWGKKHCENGHIPCGHAGAPKCEPNHPHKPCGHHGCLPRSTQKTREACESNFAS
jgi:hypothetical protein